MIKLSFVETFMKTAMVGGNQVTNHVSRVILGLCVSNAIFTICVDPERTPSTLLISAALVMKLRVM